MKSSNSRNGRDPGRNIRFSRQNVCVGKGKKKELKNSTAKTKVSLRCKNKRILFADRARFVVQCALRVRPRDTLSARSNNNNNDDCITVSHY